MENRFKSAYGKISSRCCKALIFSLILLVSISAIEAQQGVSYALHANIIYRFTKYIDWPAYNYSEDFVIGIIGDTPLHDELKNFSVNKTVGNKKIVIKKMPASANYYTCQILFISEDKTNNIKKIAEITKGSPTLIISETESRSVKGACINFIIVNEHLKLEISRANIEDRKLNIASELLRLATLIK